MADKVKKIKIQAVGLKDIKRELDDIKNSMKEATDPAEMARLTAEADKLEKSLDGVNDKVREFGEESTDSLNGAGKSFQDLKSAVTELDFTKVQAGVDSFAKASANMTFKGAITSLKSLGKTFLSLGKALLTNPIFLLAAVITGIVVAVYKFLDSLSLIEMAIDALMKPIRYIIDLFYSLTDAMGLTNEHATRAAEESAKAYEDSAERIKKSTDKTIQGLDHQIKMAQLNGESTVELERKKLVAMTETLEAEMDAAKAKLKAAQMRGDLDEAEMKALQDKVDEYDLAYGKIKNTIVEFETKVSNDRKNALKAEQEEIEKSNATKAQKAKEWADKQEAIRKEEAANRLMAKRLEEDLDLQLMEEGDAKLLKQNQLTYDRLIEDTKSNEKLNAEEKERVIKQYQDLSDAKAEEIRNAKKEKEKAAAVQAQEELNAVLYDLKTSDEQKALDDLDTYYDDALEKLRENLDKDLITKEQFAEAEALLAQEKADKLEKIEEDLAQKKKDLEDEVAEKRRKNAADALNIASEGISAIADMMQTSSDNEIAAAEGNEAKQEQLRKKAFEQQKKMQIAAAFINMAQGIVAGLGAPFPMNIAMPILAGITGAASIAKIKSTKYSGGGSASGGGSIPTPTMPSMNAPTRQAPIANFQGTGGDRNEVGAGSQSITIENNVSVSETEITDKQKTVHNLTQQSQL